MSAKLMGMIFDDLPGLATNPKMVLLKIADHADDLGRNAYPSVARIAESCGLSIRSVQRVLREFRQEGTLNVEAEAKGGRGKGQPTVYRIDLARARELHGSGAEKGDTLSPISGEKGDNRAEKGDTGGINGCQALSPEPFLEPSKEPLEYSTRAREGRSQRRRVSHARGRLQQVPADWRPHLEDRRWARAHLHQQLGGVVDDENLDAIAAQFVDHHRSRGTVFADISRAWRNWIRRVPVFDRTPVRQRQAIARGGRAEPQSGLAMADRILARREVRE